MTLNLKTLVLKTGALGRGVLQGGDLRTKIGHLGLEGLELLTTDQIEVRGPFVCLGAKGGPGLLAGRLGDAHGGLSQLRHFVEKRVLSLHDSHLYPKTHAKANRAFAAHTRKRGG